jgi:hypothetical protein
VRRLGLVLLLTFAGGMYASVQQPTAISSKSFLSANHSDHQKAPTSQKWTVTPVTAAPADGKSFVNEFLDDDSVTKTTPEQGATNSNDTASLNR